MGWCGHNIYDGDDTQTLHVNYLKFAKIGESDDQRSDMLHLRKTIIPKNMRSLLRKNYKLILNKMPKRNFLKRTNSIFDKEYSAIKWQMLLALFVDNNIKPPKIIKHMGIKATEYLMEDHSADFDEPAIRRKNLRKFLSKVGELGNDYERPAK